jgi:DDE superfamily endonuclease
MQATHYAINCWSPIEVSDIILLSGVEQMSGKYFNINSLPTSYSWNSPANKEELFNLRHASARNVIERIFGILKHRFRILVFPPEYSMELQARIPAALCALHNFIRHADPTEIDEYADATDLANGRANGAEIGNLATQAINAADRDRMSLKRDQIAQDMWDSYMTWVQRGEADLEAAPPV